MRASLEQTPDYRSLCVPAAVDGVRSRQIGARAGANASRAIRLVPVRICDTADLLSGTIRGTDALGKDSGEAVSSEYRIGTLEGHEGRPRRRLTLHIIIMRTYSELPEAP